MNTVIALVVVLIAFMVLSQIFKDKFAGSMFGILGFLFGALSVAVAFGYAI